MTNTSNEMKQYFTQKEALEMVLETINSGSANYIEDLHHDTFNTNYYIIGTYEATQALEQYGVFKAIKDVQEYEKFNFGEVYTDTTNPEELANMLMYIVGEKALQKIKTIDKHWGEEIEEKEAYNEITQEIKEAIAAL